MNILKLIASSAGGGKSGNSFNHHLAHGFEAGFFDKIKATVKNKIEGYKAQSREERGIEQVLQMSDSMLKDIGLTHADRASLKAGLTSLKELNAQRENSSGQHDWNADEPLEAGGTDSGPNPYGLVLSSLAAADR